jgi:hypothetical protein
MRRTCSFQDLFRDEVPNRAFHDAPRRGGAQIDELLCVEQLLKLWLDARVEVFESLAAVADHRGAKRLERFLAHFNRAWDV